LGSPITAQKLDALARHVTIGETYFFREPATFKLLTREILPDILRQRRSAGLPSLKIWSAGCATGEEAYSLAMSLDSVRSELDGWDASVLATDVNSHFIQTAHQAMYKPWSFRGVDAKTRRQYFKSIGKAYEVIPEIRRRVSFSHLNLAADRYPSQDIRDLDLIVCRNVLMYFAPEAARAAVGRFAAALRPGGWLIVGAAEYSQTLFKDFETVNFGAAFFYRRPPAKAANAPCRAPVRVRKSRNAPWPIPTPGRAGSGDVAPDVAARLAQTAADRGMRDEALMWANRAIAAHKTDAGLHYLHGQIQLEAGNLHAAAAALDRAIYLKPEFALAHFLRAIVAQAIGREARAQRHFANALAALAPKSADDAVDGADGLTVANLTDMINAAAHQVAS
jgi:chemotaxis protein methyltransferase CheR